MNPASLTGHILELQRSIERSAYPPDHIVTDFFRSRKYLGSHDRRAIANAVFGLIRHRRFTETLLEQFSKNHPGTEILSDPAVRALPIFVCYSELVDAGVKVPSAFWKIHFPNIDLSQYITWIKENSSLTFLSHDNIQRLGVQYSFPDWMVRAWNDHIGDETEDLLRGLNTQAPTALRVNVLLTDRAECQRRLAEEGIETEFTKISPVGLIAGKRFNSDASAAYNDGWFEIQDEGSQLISLLVQPRPGSVVIDACAGAGGKSLHMAELMKNEGEIIALDIDPKRLNKLRKRAERAHITIIRSYSENEIQRDDLIGKADFVLIDAPCSGSGTIRRNPALKWSITPSLVKHYSEQQLDILDRTVPFLKTDGTMLYATCSLFSDENEAVVRAFLEKNPEYRVYSIEDRLAPYNLTPHGSLLTLYPHRHQTDGFFAAIIKRQS
jgi:16S rRNA (cytosine967-C5)-methyltransferase